MKKIFLFVIAVAVCGALFAESKRATASTKQAVPAPFSKGINLLWLADTVDSAGLIQSNYYTEKDFDDIKSLGVDVVRFPVRFEKFSTGAPDYIVSEKVFSVIDSVISWAQSRGIYVIIDDHSMMGDEKSSPKDLEARVLKVWAQVADRYKGSGSYVLYEVYNEPHAIDPKKWAAVQGKAIEVIRAVDKTHKIVVGGAEWNKTHTLLELPEYDDKNLIYNFHFYLPFMFTHQGAPWTDYKNFSKVPFPYDKARMPKVPRGSNDWLRNEFNNYKNLSSEEVIFEDIDKVVDFSIKRGAPVMCDEFGIYRRGGALPEDRCAWFKAVTDYFSARGIAYTSWGYDGTFGLFKVEHGTFPQDLDKEEVLSQKFNLPKETRRPTWKEKCDAAGIYSLYKNGVERGIRVNGYFEEDSQFVDIEKIDAESSEKIVEVARTSNKCRPIHFILPSVIDLEKSKDSGGYLEFEARTLQDDFVFHTYFTDDCTSGDEWRAEVYFTKKEVPADGKWHTVKIPLNEFKDCGAWSTAKTKWLNARGLFDWKNIREVSFESAGVEQKKPIAFRNIQVVK